MTETNISIRLPSLQRIATEFSPCDSRSRKSSLVPKSRPTVILSKQSQRRKITRMIKQRLPNLKNGQNKPPLSRFILEKLLNQTNFEKKLIQSKRSRADKTDFYSIYASSEDFNFSNSTVKLEILRRSTDAANLTSESSKIGRINCRIPKNFIQQFLQNRYQIKSSYGSLRLIDFKTEKQSHNASMFKSSQRKIVPTTKQVRKSNFADNDSIIVTDEPKEPKEFMIPSPQSLNSPKYLLKHRNQASKSISKYIEEASSNENSPPKHQSSKKRFSTLQSLQSLLQNSKQNDGCQSNKCIPTTNNNVLNSPQSYKASDPKNIQKVYIKHHSQLFSKIQNSPGSKCSMGTLSRRHHKTNESLVSLSRMRFSCENVQKWQENNQKPRISRKNFELITSFKN